MNPRVLSVLALTAILIPPLQAGDFPAPRAEDVREAAAMSRFLSLETGRPTAGSRFAIVGLDLAQESGRLKLGIEQIQASRENKTTLIEDLQIEAPLTADSSFMNNPAGGVLQALVAAGKLTIRQVDTSVSSGLGEGAQGVSNIVFKFRTGAFSGRLKYGFISARVSGTAAYDGGQRRLVLTITDVNAGIPVGLGRIFEALENALDFDWTLVEQPRVTFVFDEMFQ